MTGALETAFRQTLKTVVREVLNEVLRERELHNASAYPPKADGEGRFLLRAREAAKRLAISERHLDTLTSQGVLPCVRVGRLVHYSVETIERWIHKSETTEPESKSEKRARLKTTKRQPRKETPSKRELRKPKSPQQSKPKTHRQTKRKVRQQSKPAEPEHERISPFSQLLADLGVDREKFADITNGEIRNVAQVDIPTLHGWQYLNRQLPDDAMQRLREHFSAYADDNDAK